MHGPLRRNIQEAPLAMWFSATQAERGTACALASSPQKVAQEEPPRPLHAKSRAHNPLAPSFLNWATQNRESLRRCSPHMPSLALGRRGELRAVFKATRIHTDGEDLICSKNDAASVCSSLFLVTLGHSTAPWLSSWPVQPCRHAQHVPLLHACVRLPSFLVLSGYRTFRQLNLFAWPTVCALRLSGEILCENTSQPIRQTLHMNRMPSCIGQNMAEC